MDCDLSRALVLSQSLRDLELARGELELRFGRRQGDTTPRSAFSKLDAFLSPEQKKESLMPGETRERELIRERTRAGEAAARARGRLGGRPGVMTEQKLEVARKMLESGDHRMATIARSVGVSTATVYRHVPRGGDVDRQAAPRLSLRRHEPRSRLPDVSGCGSRERRYSWTGPRYCP